MGAWGAGLYANDVTCDVRDSYMAFLQDQLGNTEAFEKTLCVFRELIGDEDEPLFWFALAETQWKTGRLLPEVKVKAIEWIEKGGGLELWEESESGGAGWSKTLQKLKIKLESPMPQEKKIRKPPVLNQNPWNLFDIYAYQFHGEKSKESGFYGKYMILQKIGEDTERFSSPTMRIHVLDRIFDKLPTLDDIEGIRILPLDNPHRTTMNDEQKYGEDAGVHMNCCIDMYKKRAYPVNYLTYIGNQQGPENKLYSYDILSWENIDNWLSFYHLLWRGIEYETIEVGVFRYINK